MLVSWRVGLGLIIGCLLIRRVGRQGRGAGLGGGWGWWVRGRCPEVFKANASSKRGCGIAVVVCICICVSKFSGRLGGRFVGRR